MREVTEPFMTSPRTGGNLTDALVHHAQRTPSRILMVRREGDAWIDTSAADVHERVKHVAKGFSACGIRPGDRIAVMSRTRHEWTILDYAIWYAGCVTVPIYETSSVEQMQWILRDSGAVALVVEKQHHLQQFYQVTETVVQHSWVIEADGLELISAAGVNVSDGDIEERRSGVRLDDIATIVYTSGTTGNPKGCELTHGNMLHITDQARSAVPEIFDDPNTSTLLFLPLAHIFGRAIQCIMMESGLKTAYAPDATRLVDDLGVMKPNFVLAVPRVFEKIFNAAQQKAYEEGKGKIFDAAAAVCIAYSKASEAGRVPLALSIKHAVFDALVYKKIRARLGGNVQWAVSGGAALGARLGHFFRGIGLVALEGYGLTETTAPLTVNRPSRVRVGSVGPALPGITLRIADDGEILAKGASVMRGYYRNPVATGDVIDADGWFHTGDVGHIDDDGFLFITGRKKELLVTAQGKNVAPAPLEDRIRAHALVSQCMVVGDNRPYVAALITLDPEALGPWARAHGLPENATAVDLHDNPELIADIQQAVDGANRMVSTAESIRKFKILTTDWTEAGGQLTPSLKLRRNVVMKEAAEAVESLYRD
jgi:long-chain acyl-CoA synthetase